jgi:hypothetical protein
MPPESPKQPMAPDMFAKSREPVTHDKSGASESRDGSEDLILVERITVLSGRLVCRVAIPDPRFRYGNHKLGAVVRRAFPSIKAHSCVNGESDMFDPVLDTTSVPHVLEHIAIDIQIHETKKAEQLVGATEWLDEDAGIAIIQLSFADDFEALSAFKQAVTFLNKVAPICY